MGGDELLGGPRAPALELADHLHSGALNTFLRRSLDWASYLKTPVYGLAVEALLLAGRSALRMSSKQSEPPAWVSPEFTRSPGDNQEPQPRRLPSMYSAVLTWDRMIATLPHLSHSPVFRYEYLYPFLDRDLVGFLARVPREQLMRPGQQRSLMRRALRGIVPAEVLERKRKAYVSRGFVVGLTRAKEALEADRSHWTQRPSAEYLDLARLAGALAAATKGDTQHSWIALYKAMAFKTWVDECLPRIWRAN